MLGWLRHRVAEWRRKRMPRVWRVVWTDEVFRWEEIGGDGWVQEMRWEDVASVRLVKVDVFSYDELVLVLRSGEGEEIVTWEQDEGWSAFADTMEKYLPGIVPIKKWYHEVAFTGFKPTDITIYERGRGGEVVQVR